MEEIESNDLTLNPLKEENKKVSLLKKELDINLQEQSLVKKRIDLLKKTLKEIPNTDPQYAILISQLEMDQIELDELDYRSLEIKSKIEEYS